MMKVDYHWYKVGIIVVIIVFASTCGLQVEKQNFKEFEESRDRGERLVLNGEYDQAVEQYQKAYEIAERMQWVEGRSSIKQHIAEVYSKQKRYQEAEEFLVEAKSICVADPKCSNVPPRTVWNDLMFLYLFSIKDIAKAKQLIQEIIDRYQRPSDNEELRKLLEEYSSWMRDAGFPQEAVKLEAEIRSLPD